MSIVDRENIEELILSQGFLTCGFSPALPVDEPIREKFNSWLQQGHHASMSWLENNGDKRFDPALLHPGTKTVISMLHAWPESNFDQGDLKIAAYAHGADYHDFLRQQAKPILDMLANADATHTPRFFTDSAPIPDRYWAQKAGIGFIGKNGFLIHPEFGSRFFIAHIFTSIEFKTDNKQLTQACGSCNRCIDACPTSAFTGQGTIEAARCLAYWNIEYKEEIPAEIASKNPGWIFGCDICQQACPFNNKSLFCESQLAMKGHWQSPSTAQEWLDMDEDFFVEQYRNTPLGRAGLQRIQSIIKTLRNSKRDAESF